MGCCIHTRGGRPAGGGGTVEPVPRQGFTVQGLVDPGIVASDPAEALVSVWSGATQPFGSVPIADWLVRVDDPVLGSTFKVAQSGIYVITATVALPSGGTSGLLVGAGVDHTAAQRSGADGNPEPWWPENVDTFFWSNWTAGSGIAPIKSKGPMHVSSAQAADANLGILRVLLSNVSAAPPTSFDTIPAIASLRVERIGNVD